MSIALILKLLRWILFALSSNQLQQRATQKQRTQETHSTSYLQEHQGQKSFPHSMMNEQQKKRLHPKPVSATKVSCIRFQMKTTHISKHIPSLGKHMTDTSSLQVNNSLQASFD